MFQTFSDLIDKAPEVWNPVAMRIDDKIFIDQDNGVRIYPRDGSYKRFIRDSWYDGVDVENL